jgi:hypothetical protein
MDFSAHRTEHPAAVPLDWDFAVRVVLRGGTGDGRELGFDALDIPESPHTLQDI